LESQPIKLLLKLISKSDIELFCGTKTPTEETMKPIIDDWIFMSPPSNHIAKAYAVYRDGGLGVSDSFFLLTQFYEGYTNVYDHIKTIQRGSATALHETVPD
jgi:hypothetical protein